jgi:methylmalonyl-CoA mutase cobalamin-binding subunit
MRVEVVDLLPETGEAGGEVADAAVERAVKNFVAAMGNEDSLFAVKKLEAVRTSGAPDADPVCGGAFALEFREASQARSQSAHFSLLQKLAELLKDAGSPDTLVVTLCVCSGSVAEEGGAGFGVRVRLEAKGKTSEQAALRWGLGLAHVQQALLFTSRYLRQQLGKSGDRGA